MNKMIMVLIGIVCLSSKCAASKLPAQEEEWLQFIASSSQCVLSHEEYVSLYHTFFNNLAPMEEPELIILGGGPGAGKTTYRKTHLGEKPQFHLHDMDEVLVRLSSYTRDFESSGTRVAFEKNWPTAQKVANQLVSFAFHKRFNVIYDRTCGSDASFQDLKSAIQDKGYKATMYAFYVDEQTALERVQQREQDEKRAISQEIVIEYTARFSKLFPQYLMFIPKVTLFHSSHICFQQTNDRSEIVDNKFYKKFLKYGLNNNY